MLGVLCLFVHSVQFVAQNIAIVLGYMRFLPLVWIQGSCASNDLLVAQLSCIAVVISPPSLLMLLGPCLLGPSSSAGRRSAGSAIGGGSISRCLITIIEVLSGGSRFVSLPVRLVANAISAHIAISLLLVGVRAFLGYGSWCPGFFTLDICCLTSLWFASLPLTHQFTLRWFAVTDIELFNCQFFISVLVPLVVVCSSQRSVDVELASRSLRSALQLSSWFDWSALLLLVSHLLTLVGLGVSSFCLLLFVVAKLLTIAIQSDVASRLAATYHIEWC